MHRITLNMHKMVLLQMVPHTLRHLKIKFKKHQLVVLPIDCSINKRSVTKQLN